MKKVIATAAGLMLLGAMAGSAMADVTFSGDARARFWTKDNFDLNDDADDDNSKIESRVRLAFEGNHNGAFAKARLNIGEATWDGGHGTNDIYTDYAYIGLPVVEGVTVTAGRQINEFGNGFWIQDERADRLKGVWANEATATTLAAFYDKSVEFVRSTSTITVTGVDQNGAAASGTITSSSLVASSEASDDDINLYGLYLKQGLGADWTAELLGLYRADDVNNGNADTTGYAGGLAFTGKLPGATLVGEFSYQDADFQGTEDAGYGGFIGVVLPIDQLTIVLPAAYTADGFVADDDWKPTYLYGVGDPMGIMNFGAMGDTWAVAPSVDFKIVDNVTLHGGVAYADVDGFAKITELDGGLRVDVTDQSWCIARADRKSVV